MRRTNLLVWVALAVGVAACGGAGSSFAPTGAPGSDGFPSCEEVPNIAAPSEAYRDEPIYVGNEMAVEEVQAWATAQPGYQGIWIDREHNGWISVAFTEDVATRQADIDQLFPDDGVVAVEVQHDRESLDDLQSRVVSAMGEIADKLGPEYASWGVGSYENKGVVGLDVGVLTPELLEELEARFAGEPLCVDGLDPSLAPEPGPQPDGGEGWQLLVSEPGAGEPWRTGIAADPTSYAELWLSIGLSSTIPEVDFEDHIVIWFGPAVSGSCSDVRLDDVVVDGSVIYPVTVLPTPQVACTDDANPHAFVVALDRSKLPAGPFSIQLAEEVVGLGEERTTVTVDLSEPGTSASPDKIIFDPAQPDAYYAESGDIIETGFPVPYRLYTHCGIDWLGEFNGYVWKTDQTLPPEWEAVTNDETIGLEILLLTGDPPTIEAEANGATVVYTPTDQPIPGCD